jgi:tRNA(adenine34) deaminase
MRQALVLAAQAAEAGEVPVGAVVVYRGEVIATGSNRREIDRQPFAHAELLAMQAAASALGAWRLSGTTVYVTLEPCSMCAGALVLARVDRLVFGATDPKAGAVGSVFNLVQEPRLNHRLEVTGGILASECQEQLQAFFRRLRGKQA